MSKGYSMCELCRFFKDNNGNESMPRLLVFLSFLPATIALAWIHTTEALSVYLGAYVINYGLGKFGDAWESRGRKHAKSDPMGD